MAQARYIKESAALAQAIEASLRERVPMSARAIQQAPFRVLVGANMPAVLVEMGFITNPAQEKQLQSDEFQNLVVQALVESISRFRDARVEHASDGARADDPPHGNRRARGPGSRRARVDACSDRAAITGALIPGGCVPACRGGACRSRAKNQSDVVLRFRGRSFAARRPARGAVRAIRSPNRRAGSSRRS